MTKRLTAVAQVESIELDAPLESETPTAEVSDQTTEEFPDSPVEEMLVMPVVVEEKVIAPVNKKTRSSKNQLKFIR